VDRLKAEAPTAYPPNSKLFHSHSYLSGFQDHGRLWLKCFLFLKAMYISNYLVPERKLLIFPISASGLNFNPQNTQCIPVVKICDFLELEKIF